MTKLILQTYKHFLKECKRTTKAGYRYRLVSTGLLIRAEENKKGWVPAYQLFWLSPSYSYWSPMSVVLHQRNPGASWVGHCAGERLGFKKKQLRKIKAALSECGGHDPELRLRLLKACKVKEIPHSTRRRVRMRRKT